MSGIKDSRKAWDGDNMGFGKHTYEAVDPDTINPADYATNLRGEEQHFGDIRQYNSAYNEKHVDNDVDLNWLGRIGTVFETKGEGIEGMYVVTSLPVVKAPTVFCRVVKVTPVDRVDPENPKAQYEFATEDKEEILLSCTDLGVTVTAENLFLQVDTRLLKKGSVDKHQRARLTKKHD